MPRISFNIFQKILERFSWATDEFVAGSEADFNDSVPP
jgi:hypothetical protein